MSPGAERLGRAIACGFATVLLLTLLAFGGAHAWASALMEIAVDLLALAWFVTRVPNSRRMPRALVAVAGVFALYLVLQIVPLPRTIVARLSPGADRLYAHTIDVVERMPIDARAIAPVATPSGNTVTVLDRERVRAVATAPRSWFPGSWRTIALHPYAARADLLRYLAYALTIWFAATVPVPRLLARSVVGAGAAVAALAIVQFTTWNGHLLWFFDPYDTGPLTQHTRMSGPFVNPDHLAVFLEMAILVGAGLLARAWRPEERDPKRKGVSGERFFEGLVLGLGVAIMIAALVGTASRGGFIATIVGGLIFARRAGRRRDRHHSKPAATGVGPARRRRERDSEARARRSSRLEVVRNAIDRLAPALIAIGVILAGLTYAGSQARTTLDERLGRTFFAPDVERRVLFVSQSLPILGDFPAFGVGAGSWSEVFRRYQRYPMVGYRPTHAHDDYLEWAAEVGFVGLALTVLLVWSYVGWARSNHRISRRIRAGLVAAVAAVLLHEAFDFGLRMPANALELSIVLGLLCNPNWRPGSDAEDRPRGMAARLVAAGAVLILVTASYRQLLEFRQWLEVRDGVTSPSFAPANADTWEGLGGNLVKAGLFQQPPAEAVFRAAVARRPAAARSLWGLFLTAESDDAKLAALEAAIYVDPTKALYRRAYAAVLDTTGRTPQAFEQVEEAIYRDPRLRSHPYLDPRDLRIVPQLLDAVREGFRRAVADRPEDPILMNEAAAFHARFAFFREAADLWLEAAAEAKEWKVYGLRAGDCLAKLGDYGEAEKAIRRSIGEAPEEPDGYRALAVTVFRSQKKYDQAVEALELGIRRSEDPEPLLRSLYDVKHEAGDVKGALQALEHAADIRQRNAQVQYLLGQAYFREKDYHRAAMAFDRAIAVDGSQARFHFQKAVALEKVYDLLNAREAYRKAVELDAANARYRQSLEKIEAAFAAVNDPGGGAEASRISGEPASAAAELAELGSGARLFAVSPTPVPKSVRPR